MRFDDKVFVPEWQCGWVDFTTEDARELWNELNKEKYKVRDLEAEAFIESNLV